MIIRLLIAMAISTSIIACSNSPTDPREIEKAKDQSLARQNKRIEKDIDQIPEWVLSPVERSTTGYTSVGIGESDNLQTAIDIARLQAEFNIAKLYSQELSGSERMMAKDAGGTSAHLYEALIDKLVKRVPVTGYTVLKQEIAPHNGKYACYTMLNLPYVEFNRVLQTERGRATGKEMAAAFGELERRLDKAEQRDQRGSVTLGAGDTTGSVAQPLPDSN